MKFKNIKKWTITTSLYCLAATSILQAHAQTQSKISQSTGWQLIHKDEEMPSLLTPRPRDPWRNRSIYVKPNSKKTIKSVQFPGVTYRAADFSYSDFGRITKTRFVYQCEIAGYKTSDSDAGYLSSLTYIIPDENSSEASQVAFRYLCPKTKNPWIEFGETEGLLGKKYFLNLNTWTRAKNPKLGIIDHVLITHPISNTALDSTFLYISCSSKKLATHSKYSPLSPMSRELVLDEALPESIGSLWLDLICSNKN